MASQQAQPARLKDHGITREWGFMQTSDPVAHLSAANQEWDELATNLPKHLMGADFRQDRAADATIRCFRITW